VELPGQHHLLRFDFEWGTITRNVDLRRFRLSAAAGARSAADQKIEQPILRVDGKGRYCAAPLSGRC